MTSITKSYGFFLGLHKRLRNRVLVATMVGKNKSIAYLYPIKYIQVNAKYLATLSPSQASVYQVCLPFANSHLAY
jgi:hypothetical protein